MREPVIVDEVREFNWERFEALLRAQKDVIDTILDVNFKEDHERALSGEDD